MSKEHFGLWTASAFQAEPFSSRLFTSAIIYHYLFLPQALGIVISNITNKRTGMQLLKQKAPWGILSQQSTSYLPTALYTWSIQSKSHLINLYEIPEGQVPISLTLSAMPNNKILVQSIEQIASMCCYLSWNRIFVYYAQMCCLPKAPDCSNKKLNSQVASQLPASWPSRPHRQTQRSRKAGWTAGLYVDQVNDPQSSTQMKRNGLS